VSIRHDDASQQSQSDQDDYLALLARGIRALGEMVGGSAASTGSAAWIEFAREVNTAPPRGPLCSLVQRFRLDGFELKCVVLALVRHVDPGASDGFDPAMLTIANVIELLACDDGERRGGQEAFGPQRTLLGRGIVRLRTGAAGGILARRLELSEAAIRYILAEPEVGDAIGGVARIERPRVSLLDVILAEERQTHVRELVTHHARYRELLNEWGFTRILPHGRGLALLFTGPSGTGKSLLALALASHIDRPLITLSAGDLMRSEAADAILGALFAEATLRDAIVVIDQCEAVLGPADPRRAAMTRALEDFEGITILITAHPDRLDPTVDRLVAYHVRFGLPSAAERRQIWEAHLPPGMPLGADVDLDALSNTYDFTGAAIKNAVLVGVNRALGVEARNPSVTMARLEEGAKSQLGYALERLTVETRTHLSLDDVVLTSDARRRVEEIIAAARNQSLVLNAWGLGERLVTGKGINALFDGPPGTGKTLCAEVIAATFDRAIHRVNLPEVVSKWVGETEKNIREIFQSARVSHAMLLFDEADALFASRSGEVKNANDRYANMEVNLLLQEIERFPGVCFLTTNAFGALDKALLRRVQFRVTFQEPDAAQRAAIWRVLCPRRMPRAPDVDFDALSARYELTGGRIKNALVRAAYRAANSGTPLTQRILDEACRDEYLAEGKVLRDPLSVTVRRPRPLEPPEPSDVRSESTTS
jgi:SpoVK/Ycf46/Vps4 family AAA+-type ATPase